MTVWQWDLRSPLSAAYARATRETFALGRNYSIDEYEHLAVVRDRKAREYGWRSVFRRGEKE